MMTDDLRHGVNDVVVNLFTFHSNAHLLVRHSLHAENGRRGNYGEDTDQGHDPGKSAAFGVLKHVPHFVAACCRDNHHLLVFY